MPDAMNFHTICEKCSTIHDGKRTVTLISDAVFVSHYVEIMSLDILHHQEIREMSIIHHKNMNAT